MTTTATRDDRERVIALREDLIDKLTERGVYEDSGCSAALGHASDAFLAGLAAYDAGAYEKASLGFQEGLNWLAAYDTCVAAQKVLKSVL